MIIPSPRSNRRARIEIIPLIDIVFFLLATFVMVSLSMVKNRGVSVQLPSASTASRQSSSGAEYTTISVTDKGDIYFDKIKILPTELPARLKALKERQSNPVIFLNGDEKAFLGKAIFVLDEARKLGIKEVAIQTR